MEANFVMGMEPVLMELVTVRNQERFNLHVKSHLHHLQNVMMLLMEQLIVKVA
jgi:hypothetical protein